MKLLLIVAIVITTLSAVFSVPSVRTYNSELSTFSFSGETETRQRIAVVDTGINPELIGKSYMCKDTPVVYYGKSGLDWGGHGSNIVGLIGERINVSKYCIVMYSMSKSMSIAEEVSYLLDISRKEFIGVNISLSSETPDYVEEGVLKKLVSHGVKVFIAAGNEKVNLDTVCNAFPACYAATNPNLIIVANRKNSLTYSNYGKIVDLYIDGVDKGQPTMTGSSQATAIATGEYFSK